MFVLPIFKDNFVNCIRMHKNGIKEIRKENICINKRPTVFLKIPFEKQEEGKKDLVSNKSTQVAETNEFDNNNTLRRTPVKTCPSLS